MAIPKPKDIEEMFKDAGIDITEEDISRLMQDIGIDEAEMLILDEVITLHRKFMRLLSENQLLEDKHKCGLAAHLTAQQILCFKREYENFDDSINASLSMIMDMDKVFHKRKTRSWGH